MLNCQDQMPHHPQASYETPEEIASDIHAIAQIRAVPTLLDVLCEITGMGFAAVARVSDVSWTVCAVSDRINFGLKTGDQLPLESTLCVESRRSGEPIVIDYASLDPIYSTHRTPKQYGFESYISVPIVLSNHRYFGNLCAVDPAPAKVSAPSIVNTFKRFASLIGCQLASEKIIGRTESALRAEHETREWQHDFLTDLGHHLISPIRAIRQASDSIDGRADDSLAVRGLATRIRTDALKMSSLLETLLDFSRLKDTARLRPRSAVEATRSEDDGVNLAEDSSNRRGRTPLESLLMQRVGELQSHLGRYDMYALSIARWLEARGQADPTLETPTVRTRGASIVRRLRSLAVPESTITEFEVINRDLLSIMARQEIAAKKEASIPSLHDPRVARITALHGQRDWYDHIGASARDLSRSIEGMERDISSVASLYLRLAGWAGEMSSLPCWDS